MDWELVTWVEIFLIDYQLFTTVWNNRKVPWYSNVLVESNSTCCFICHCWNPSYSPTPAISPQQRHKTYNSQHQIFWPLRLLDIFIALNTQKENMAGDKKWKVSRVTRHWHSFIPVNNKRVKNTYSVPCIQVLGGEDEWSICLCF